MMVVNIQIAEGISQCYLVSQVIFILSLTVILILFHAELLATLIVVWCYCFWKKISLSPPTLITFPSLQEEEEEEEIGQEEARDPRLAWQ